MEEITVDRIIVQAVCEDGKLVQIELPDEVEQQIWNIIDEMDTITISEVHTIFNN
jgi:hypothetical protein